MDKSIKWQSPPPSESDPSESPTLSDKPRTTVKRKRSSILSKLRKSILSIGNSSNSDESKGQEEGKGEKVVLKRALSMDAGLLNRIEQLAAKDDPASEIQRTASIKNRLRRTKSLINSSTDFNSNNSGIGSHAVSPKINPSTKNDSILLEACDEGSLRTPINTVSLIDTIETSHLNSSHKVFNCSWLAPTKKSQLFPGHLTLIPASSSIQFTCQHFTRSIRLKFLLQDILNISRGSWNDKRNQALIIDLIRGKRKTWVFVAWEDGQFEAATDVLVQYWRINFMNRIKNRIDRRNAYFNMKYCRVIREADRANEAVKLKLESFGFLDEFYKMIKFITSARDANDDDPFIIKSNRRSFTLNDVLFEKEIEGVNPEILSLILTDQSTNFMTNFRALNDIVITNDTGWHRNSRNFVSFVSKNTENLQIKMFKWKVTQKFLVNSTDFIVLETILSNIDTPKQVMKIIHEISSIPIFSGNNRVKVTISADDMKNEEISSHFRKRYFPVVFQLLEALISESQSQEEQNIEEIRQSLMFVECDLYITTVFLPFLYKLVHFKQYKFFRFAFFSIILLIFTRFFMFYTLNYIKSSNMSNSQVLDVEGQFGSLLKDFLKPDHVDEGIHQLKLKYKCTEK